MVSAQVLQVIEDSWAYGWKSTELTSQPAEAVMQTAQVAMMSTMFNHN